MRYEAFTIIFLIQDEKRNYVYRHGVIIPLNHGNYNSERLNVRYLYYRGFEQNTTFLLLMFVQGIKQALDKQNVLN